MEILLKRTESDSQVHHEMIFCDRIRFVLAIYVHMSTCPGHVMHHRDLLRRRTLFHSKVEETHLSASQDGSVWSEAPLGPSGNIGPQTPEKIHRPTELRGAAAGFC